uniref:Uncharacterized protein n=1 Tax=Physcomitrium patens TaxID=3218 RepID=A0A7I4FCE5_PHYPA
MCEYLLQFCGTKIVKVQIVRRLNDVLSEVPQRTGMAFVHAAVCCTVNVQLVFCTC